MDNPYWTAIKTAFDKKLSKENFAITHMTATIFTGGPLKNETFRFDNLTHEENAQTDMLKEFLLEIKSEFKEEYTVEKLGF